MKKGRSGGRAAGVDAVSTARPLVRPSALGGATGRIRSVVGGVLTALLNFANTISTMAPGTTVYLDALRNGEAIQFKVILGSGPCATSQ